MKNYRNVLILIREFPAVEEQDSLISGYTSVSQEACRHFVVLWSNPQISQPLLIRAMCTGDMIYPLIRFIDAGLHITAMIFFLSSLLLFRVFLKINRIK